MNGAPQSNKSEDHETLRLGGKSWLSAAFKGWRGRCPSCGERHLFTAYVKMAPSCRGCGQEFEPFRADDAPAYFTIFIVGHIIVPLMLLVEKQWFPALWVHAALWLPGTLALSLLLLPRIKGAVIGMQWGLNMRPGEAR
jgi:uncharacterized protein (DUF983 family)